MTHIAVLGGSGDLQVQRVLRGLKARGAHVTLVDTGAFPGHGALSLTGKGLTMEGRAIAAPSAVYVRGLACHPLMPCLADALEQTPRRTVVAMEEKRSFLESLLQLWESEGARLINSPAANALHSRKPLQLALLEYAGLPVPPWLATNDPDTLKSWLGEQGACVYKPLAGGATVKLVQPEDLDEQRLESLATSPVLFQKYVQAVSVRVYVAGDSIAAAAEIRSEHLDYREGETAVVPTELSEEETVMTLKAAMVTGMPFAGVDLLRAEEQTWLLECNPSPMFATFEDKTGLNVAGPLVDLLMGAHCSRSADPRAQT